MNKPLSKPTSTAQIYKFFGQVMFWLVLCFLAWFLCARILNLPLVWLSKWFFAWFTDGVIYNVKMHDTGAVFQNIINQQFKLETIIPPPVEGGQPVFGVARPLIYGYGLAVFAALTLATPKEEGVKWRDIGIAYVIFMFVQLLGIACEAFMQLVFYSPPAISNYFPRIENNTDLLGLLYQLATLLFPPVTPVMLWIFLNTEFIESLVGKKLNRRKS